MNHIANSPTSLPYQKYKNVFKYDLTSKEFDSNRDDITEMMTSMTDWDLFAKL